MRTTLPFFSQYRLHMYMFTKYTTKTCTCQCKKEYRMIKVYISFSLFYYAYIEVLQTRKKCILIGNIQLFKFSTIIISKHKYPEQTKKIETYVFITSTLNKHTVTFIYNKHAIRFWRRLMWRLLKKQSIYPNNSQCLHTLYLVLIW